ncbi:hypothetical protein [Aquimarina spinulae]|uniref:hypothetical protein n=1 Tax=Aquimarina spinulae TaxID=1192023 RepID=UPI00131EE2E1|nr:hypothetical protein [Aquimarina spinulae]
MLPDDINDIPPDTLNGILKALHIDAGEFMYQLLNDNPKQVMIYAKIYAFVNDITKTI